jgi:protein-L-isoaspartate(D-aspartate) O-methyltransferase
VPAAFLDQLAEGGRLLIPVGTRELQELVLVRREKGKTKEEIIHGECTFVPLLGRFGWTSELSEEAT